MVTDSSLVDGSAELQDVRQRGMGRFQVGDRVVLSGHWEFDDGVIGTITLPPDTLVHLCEPGEWEGCRRVSDSERGPEVTYFVKFDEAHDDGSGDGPYWGAEIDAESLRLLKAE